MGRWAIVRAVLLLILFALYKNAAATQILYFSPQQLGARSELVVRGQVTSTYSYWNPQRTKIFTSTLVQIQETFKGAPRQTVELVQLGGIVDNVKVTVSGALQWRVGEEVLLFLEPYETGNYQVSGFSQGKFEVQRNPRGDPYIRRPALDGVEVFGVSASARRSATSKIERMALDDFVNHSLDKKK